MKGQRIERVSDSFVFRNWGFKYGTSERREWLTVEHRHECAECESGCECCDLGKWWDVDCECVTCEALKVKHEVMLAEDAKPEALALLEFWAREIADSAIREAKALEELVR